jgi:predicted nucleic acid-binding protein
VARIRVLLDACVLLPYQLADLLLWLAHAEMYEPLWSEDILDEVERNLIGKFNVSPEKASRRLNHMRSAFPYAMVADYEDLTPVMTNNPKDRHVAAAAVRGDAALIVTANLRDFSPESLQQYDIEAVHPDHFLQDQLELDPAVTLACLRQQRASYTKPQFTLREFYITLSKTVPTFVSRVTSAEVAERDPNDPLPLEIKSSDEVRQAFFPDANPWPTSPLGAATLWWLALLNKEAAGYREALRNLTYYPPVWGDFEGALDWLSGAGMMQFIERCPDDDDITYVKFMPDVAHPMRAFGDVPLKHAYILTMVLCPDGSWRAWGLSENHFPSVAEVRGAT